MSARRYNVQHIEIDGDQGNPPLTAYVEEHGLSGQIANQLTVSIFGETRGALTKIDQQGIDELYSWLGQFTQFRRPQTLEHHRFVPGPSYNDRGLDECHWWPSGTAGPGCSKPRRDLAHLA